MLNIISRIRNSVSEENPLVHCITNPISINQCANAILATGAKPIMAEHPMEVAEITKNANALVLNLGNITDVRMKSMLISSAIANENDIPVVLDLVGIACSDLRRNFAHKLVENNKMALIKGNYSEINALYNSAYKSAGVDGDSSLGVDDIEKVSVKLALKYNTMILASGKTDIITDGKKILHVKNGVPELAKVTGTGCMLGALCGCYLSVFNNMDAVVTSCAVLGICGENSVTDKGYGSYV
ncbi:MAG: hydroxyethylthiazole kinase, partial [Clostridia bacterium]|nr:hydroxyethylthiazole kinase [Clostridia bacterium]